jgi:hypothetical protein
MPHPALRHKDQDRDRNDERPDPFDHFFVVPTGVISTLRTC